MRIACTNCGQVMEVSDQMAGQIVSCARCRTNIQIPMVARQTAAPPGRPVQGGAPMRVPPGTPMRHYGRGLGITLGILMLLLLVLPIGIVPPQSGGGGAQSTGVQIAWPWQGAVAAQANQAREWVQYLLPGIAGLLAILGACLPSPVRGMFLWLGGLGLLLTMQLWPAFVAGVGNVPVDMWMLVFLPALLFMVIGGHGSAMRGSGKLGSRLAAGLPTLMALGAIAVVLVIQLPKQQATVGQFAPGGGMPTGQGWLANLALGLAWAFLGLVGLSVLLGLVNLFAGHRGVGVGGYVCGILGFVSLVAMLLVPMFVAIFRNIQAVAQSDVLCGFGTISHMVLPQIFGLILVLSGWGSMWKLDKPAVVTMNP